MRGKKTSIIEPAEKIISILKKHHYDDFSYGIITQVRGRKDHRITIKITSKSGCLLFSITGKRYKQEIRLYRENEKENIEKILKEKLNENFRLI